jgi:hypothetical protein
LHLLGKLHMMHIASVAPRARAKPSIRSLDNDVIRDRPTRQRELCFAGTCLVFGFNLVAATARADGPAIPDVVESISDNAASSQALGAGDVVESIDAGGARPGGTQPGSGAPGSAAPAVESPTDTRFELHGWTRQSLEVGFAQDIARALSPAPYAVPYDQLVARTQLLLRARYSIGRYFEANVSGTASYNLFEQGTAQAGIPFNGFNGQSRRGTVEPRLLELFVGCDSAARARAVPRLVQAARTLHRFTRR